MSDQEFNAVIQRFLQAIETGNEAALRELYRNDALIWHNNSNDTMSKDANIAMLMGLWRDGVRLRYVFDEQLVAGNRGVRRHRVEATTRGGQRFVFHVAMFATIEDGQIVRANPGADIWKPGGTQEILLPVRRICRQRPTTGSSLICRSIVCTTTLDLSRGKSGLWSRTR